MYGEDDIHYALEMTEVIHEPDRRIDTFSSTRFEFLLLTELMDSVDRVRIREGRVEAEKPLILTAESMHGFNFEGFGEKAEDFGRWLGEHFPDVPFLKYGFNFRALDVTENVVHESMANVRDRVVSDTIARGNPLSAVIEGTDDAWEISVLKFTIEMIQKSHGINIFDFKRRGLL